MQFIRRLAQATKTNSTTKHPSEDTNRATMATFFSRPPTIPGDFAPSTGSWGFHDLDKANTIDDDGDIVIIGEKRSGNFQEIERPSKSLKLQDGQRSEEEAGKIKDDSARGRPSDSVSNIPSIANPGHSPFARPVSNGSILRGWSQPSVSSSRGTINTMPFLIEDDSDEDAPPSPPPPSRPEPKRDQVSNIAPNPGFDAAQKEAARLESSRMRQEALASKNNSRAHTHQDAKPVQSTQSRFMETRNAKPYMLTPDEHDPVSTSPAKPGSILGDSTITRNNHGGSQYAQSQVPIGEERFKTRRLDSSRVHEKLQGQIQASNAQGNQEVEAAWRAAERAKKSTPAEMTAKEAAAQTRRAADAKREADWRNRQEKRRADERRAYEEAERKQIAQQEATRKQQANHALETNAADMRVSALAKLHQANKAAAERRATEVSQKSSSPAKPSGLRLDEPMRGAGSTTAATSDLKVETWNASQAERIRIKQARNEMMRKAEEKEEEETAVKLAAEVAHLRANQHVSRGPHSLQSLEGRKLLTGSAKAPLLESKNDPANRTNVQQSEDVDAYLRLYKRNLGEILPQDIKVLVWKDRDNMRWQDVEILFEREYGKRRHKETLRKRLSQVREAVLAVKASKTLLDSVALGDADATARLNALIKGNWQVPPPCRDTRMPFEATPVLMAKAMNADQDGQCSSPDTLSCQSTVREPSNPIQGSSEPTPDAERHQHGGKTWGPEVFRHYLEHAAQNLYDQYDEESRREQSPITDEDYSYFAYQLQRRQVTKAETGEGLTIEDFPWINCGEEYDAMRDANVAANNEVFCVPLGHPPIAIGKWNLTHEDNADTDDLEVLTLEGENTGMVQVRVIRLVRTYERRELPTDMDGLISRTVFFVMEKTVTTKKGDGLFEENEKIISWEPVASNAYTVLGMANKCAAKRFVDLTFTPKSVNLKVRALEVQDQEKAFLDELDDGESEMFCESRENKDGSEQTTVWVEEGRLCGPRNLR